MGQSVSYDEIEKLSCFKNSVKESNEKLATNNTIKRACVCMSFGIAAFLYGKVLYTYAAY